MLQRKGHGLQSPTDLNSKYHLATYQLVTLGKYLNLHSLSFLSCKRGRS